MSLKSFVLQYDNIRNLLFIYLNFKFQLVSRFAIPAHTESLTCLFINEGTFLGGQIFSEETIWQNFHF